MIVYWILLLITAFFAYNIGSISTMRVASRFVFRRNLRKLGTGSKWISNFKRLYGYLGFAKLLLVEVVKDLLPILLGGLLLGLKGHADAGRAFAGFCLLLGRLYPVFNRFKGGHGSVALVVAILCVDASAGAAAAVVMLAVIWFTRYISLGVVAGAVIAVITVILVVDSRLLMILCVLMAALAVIRHLPAMARLARGREEKLIFQDDITYKLDEKF